MDKEVRREGRLGSPDAERGKKDPPPGASGGSEAQGHLDVTLLAPRMGGEYVSAVLNQGRDKLAAVGLAHVDPQIRVWRPAAEVSR